MTTLEANGVRLAPHRGGSFKPAWLWTAGMALAASALIILALLSPVGSVIEIGADERSEVMKASLWARGYSLYDPMWNDQPPLHTILLGCLFRAFGPSIGVGRTLAVFFALLLFAGVYAVVRKCAGSCAASVAAVVLLFAPQVLELSISVILEVPAMALGVWALYPICRSASGLARLRKRDWIASAAVLAIALQVKLTAVLFAPAICVAILLAAKRTDTDWFRRGLANVSLWLFVFLACFVAVGCLLGHDYGQAWESHFTTPIVHPEERNAHALSLNEVLNHWEGFAGGLICFALAARARSLSAIAIPSALLATVAFIHLIHRPWWSYYYLHFAIPLAWLAGQAVAEAFRWTVALLAQAKFALTRLLLTLPCATLAALLAAEGGRRLVSEIDSIRALPRVEQSALIAKMRHYAPYTRWAYARFTMFVFHAGLVVPPELAVMVRKRVWSGQMDDRRLLAILEAYRPEQLLLPSAKLAPGLEVLVRDEYVSVYLDREVELFVAKKLNPFPREGAGGL